MQHTVKRVVSRRLRSMQRHENFGLPVTNTLYHLKTMDVEFNGVDFNFGRIPY